jgi:FMN reductase
MGRRRLPECAMSVPLLLIVDAGVGHPSRTRALAEAVAESAVGRIDGRAIERQHLSVAALAPLIGPALSRSVLPADAEAALRRIETADALIVATPVYKGSYTGLFKHLFDFVDTDALRGKPVALVATGGGERHALVVEHQLRPLFGFFQARTLPTAVYGASAEFDGITVRAESLRLRVHALAAELADSF